MRAGRGGSGEGRQDEAAAAAALPPRARSWRCVVPEGPEEAERATEAAAAHWLWPVVAAERTSAAEETEEGARCCR